MIDQGFRKNVAGKLVVRRSGKRLMWINLSKWANEMHIFVSHVNIHQSNSSEMDSNNQMKRMTCSIGFKQSLCLVIPLNIQWAHGQSSRSGNNGGYDWPQESWTLTNQGYLTRANAECPVYQHHHKHSFSNMAAFPRVISYLIEVWLHWTTSTMEGAVFFFFFFFTEIDIYSRHEFVVPACTIQLSLSAMSDSLWPHGLQHTRPSCPSPMPRVYSNSCLLSWWCHTTISTSVNPFSFCLQSFSASGSFQMNQFFALGGQSTGVSALASVLPMHIQDWFPLGWPGWISLLSKGLLRVFSNATVQKHRFFCTQLSL